MGRPRWEELELEQEEETPARDPRENERVVLAMIESAQRRASARLPANIAADRAYALDLRDRGLLPPALPGKRCPGCGCPRKAIMLWCLACRRAGKGPPPRPRRQGPPPDSLAGRLVRRRRALRVSRRELAMRAGISESTLRVIEVGLTNPLPATLEKLAMALSTTPIFLAQGGTDSGLGGCLKGCGRLGRLRGLCGPCYEESRKKPKPS